MTKDQLINRAIGRRIREIREKKGMSHWKLANRARLHHNTVKKAETGRPMYVSSLIRIILVLDVTMNEFWKGMKE